jgi:cytochrome c oxidase subunit IV
VIVLVLVVFLHLFVLGHSELDWYGVVGIDEFELIVALLVLQSIRLAVMMYDQKER